MCTLVNEIENINSLGEEREEHKPVGRGNPLEKHRSVGHIDLSQVFHAGDRTKHDLDFVGGSTLQALSECCSPESVFDAKLEETKQFDLVGVIVQGLTVGGRGGRVVHFVAFHWLAGV